MVETGRTNGHSYDLDINNKTIWVSDFWYPVPGWGNFQANHLKIRLTKQRVWVEDWITRDNWNGSGVENGDKVPFDNREEVLSLINKAKELMYKKADMDKDDHDYEIMKFVGKIFLKFSNRELSEEMEEVLDL